MKNCGCVIKTLYGLPCAHILAMKIWKNLSVRFDEINPHWQRLRVGEEEGEGDHHQKKMKKT